MFENLTLENVQNALKPQVAPDGAIKFAIEIAKEDLADMVNITDTQVLVYVLHILFNNGQLGFVGSISFNGLTTNFNQRAGDPYLAKFNSLRRNTTQVSGLA